MSFTTASAPQVVSANSFKKSFKKSFKAGPSLVCQASSKKLETGKVFRPGKARAQAEHQPSLSNRRSFRVSPPLRKIAAEAVAAQDSHNSLAGVFSFKTNCRKSLKVAEAMSPSRPTTPPTHTVMTLVSGDVGDVVESCEQGLAPMMTERRPPETPPQLEGEWRVKKAGGGDNDAAAPKKPAGGAYPDLAHLRRPFDGSNPAGAVNANRRPSSVQQIMQGLVGAGKEIMGTKLFADEVLVIRVGDAKNQKQCVKPTRRDSCRPEDKWWLY